MSAAAFAPCRHLQDFTFGSWMRGSGVATLFWERFTRFLSENICTQNKLPAVSNVERTDLHTSVTSNVCANMKLAVLESQRKIVHCFSFVSLEEPEDVWSHVWESEPV